MSPAAARSAAVLAVGSELLLAGRKDTNGDWLVARLLDLGVVTVWRAAVSDDVEAIARLVELARDRAEVVVVTGGLGPTDDDRTRDALARALALPLERDPEMMRHIEGLFTARGRIPSQRQGVQAERPTGTAWIDNPLGSAPGILLERGERVLVSLPGVPAEMRAMFEASVAPRLSSPGSASLFRRTFHVAGRPESAVDDLVRDVYGRDGTETTILASAGTVELVVLGRGAEPGEARRRVDEIEAEFRRRLGDDLFGTDGESLASVTGELLLSRRETVAVAESCTGGLLGGAFTDVPGSSAWFRGGIVAYADDVKASLASVPDALLKTHGAVSEPVARALASGARRACDATYGLGITGIAGPGGGTPDKPVGTVHIALDDGGGGRARKLDWPGDRHLIRRRAVAAALDLLRRRLLER